MPLKVTFIFNFKTVATTGFEDAMDHFGSIRETHWLPETPAAALDAATAAKIDAWAYARLKCLPVQAAIQAYRWSSYLILGNKLKRVASSFVYKNFGFGSPGVNTDVPQIALGCDGTNATRDAQKLFRLRLIPDSMVTSGEYAPTPAFRGDMNAFLQLLQDGTWGWIGRNAAAQQFPVLSVAAGVVRVIGAAGIAQGDTVQLIRVRTDASQSIAGQYRVTLVAGDDITVAGIPAGSVVTFPNGFLRKAGLAFQDIALTTLNRVTTQRVGNVAEPYRGRRTR